MSILFRAFIKWIPFAATIVILSGTAYLGIQQNYRMGANDPQIQISHDAVIALTNGMDPTTMVPSTLGVDISKSLGLSVGVYDETGKAYGSSAQIDGKPIIPPAGTFDIARSKGENRFTWQPKEGVRQAAVLVHYNTNDGKAKGFVLVSRSLKEIENRVATLTKIFAMGTAIALVVVYLLIFKLLWLKGWHSRRMAAKMEAAKTDEGLSPHQDSLASDAIARESAETSAEGHDYKVQ